MSASNEERLKSVKQFLRERKFDEAIGILDELLAENPDSIPTVQNLGAACFAAGRLEDAVAHFEHLVRLAPQEATAFVNLGAVLNRMGNFRKAGDTLRRGVQRDRKCAPAYYNLGIAHRGEGSNAMAVSSYKEALRIDPDMVDAHYNLANVYVEMGNNQQAILHYREALARKPDFAKAERGLAKAEQAANESRKALSPFGRLVEPGQQKKKSTAEVPSIDPSRSGILNVTLELTEEQRVADRNVVHDVSALIRTSYEELVTVVRERFEPAVASLNKVVSQGKQGKHLLSEMHEDYRSALEELRVARRALELGTTKLHDHEATLLDEAK